MKVNLNQVLPEAAAGDYAIPGFNVFGFEDASAVITAAENVGVPVILLVNKDSLAHFPLRYFGPLLVRMADDARIPVVVHLDHHADPDLIFQAMDLGFSSVMYDGSHLPLADNIRFTNRVLKRAHAAGVSVEGEVGAIPRDADPGRSDGCSNPAEISTYVSEAPVDALAVSIGNIHRWLGKKVTLDLDLLSEIEALTPVPLVIHGTTGIDLADLKTLKRRRVAKFNIGTALRKSFGDGLRRTLRTHPAMFDRIDMFAQVKPDLLNTVTHYLNHLAVPPAA